MVHWMRKYRRYIFIGIAVVTIPTFIYWGGSRGSRSRHEQGRYGEMNAVAVVAGVPVMRAEFQRRLYSEADRRARYGNRPTLQQLAQDGTAERLLNSMIDMRLIEIEAAKMNVEVSREFLTERIKKDPQFQDEKGNFSPAIWNEFVKSNVNWNDVYAQTRSDLAREMLIKQIVAPARVLDSELRDQFAQSVTKIQVKYVMVDPKIEPTEEQIKQQYDAYPENYEIPEQRSIEYTAISLIPPKPAEVDEIMAKLHAGEDFGELARAHSKASNALDSGHMGWIKEGQGGQHARLFTIPVGQFSEPFYEAGGYYIYKVTEESVDETGAHSVKAQDIFIPAQLDDAGLEGKMEQAQALVDKAQQSNDLKTASAEAGLEVKTLSGISRKSGSDSAHEIDAPDFQPLKKAVLDLPKGEVSNVVEGARDLFVIKVTEVTPAVPQPLEAVRDQVVEETINNIRYSPEHKAEMKKLGNEIASKAKSLQEVVDQHPEYALEIKSSPEFDQSQMLIEQGIYLPTSQILDAFDKEDVGAFAGPLVSLRSEIFFMELEKRTPPSDDMWANDWPKQEKQLREQALNEKQQQLLIDFLADARERAERANLIQRNYEVLTELLAPEQDETEAPADEAAASADAAAAPADETTPAPAPEAEAAPADQ